MLRLIWPEFTLASITRISSANGRLRNDSDVSSPDRAGLIKFCLQGIEHSGLPPQDPGHYAFFPFVHTLHCDQFSCHRVQRIELSRQVTEVES